MAFKPESDALGSFDAQEYEDFLQAMRESAGAARQSAKAQQSFAKATVSAAKAARSIVHSFDELHLVQSGTGRVRTSKGKASSSAAKEAGKGPQNAFSGIAGRLRAQLAALQRLYDPALAAWGNAFLSLGESARSALAAAGRYLNSLLDGSLRPLAQYITGSFLPCVINAFSVTAAPVLRDFGALAARVLTDGFAGACRTVHDLIRLTVLPALTQLGTVFSGVFETIGSVYTEKSAALSEKTRALLEGISGLWQSFYDGVLLPAMRTLGGLLDGIWQEHLAPLWEKLVTLGADFYALFAGLWADTLLPLLRRLTQEFAPVFSTVFSAAAETVKNAVISVCGTVGGIADALRGVIGFLTGTFAGDWAGAWEGIRQIAGGAWNAITALIRGSVNLIIDCLNGMLRGAAAAVNGVIGALNTVQVTVPKWVPVYGGRNFGISLPSVSAPQIPRLAQGAVIPPGAEFLAVLGDQKHGRNLETPEALLRQIVREESGGTVRMEADAPIEVQLDGEVLYRAMAQIRAGRGAAVGGYFAESC